MIIKTLGSLSQADLPLAGGKAVNLGWLMQAGLRVPDGFVVIAAANQVGNTNFENQILAAYDALGAERVAVRSSAVSEDGSMASWAGQLDTYLHVNRAKLIEQIQRCQASAQSARAQAYATERQQPAGHVAVVVQAMVPSQVSGVAFSAHPVTNDPQQLIIEAGLGLGEAIVSGQITPDSYLVDKPTGNITHKHLSTQSQMLIADIAQPSWHPTGPAGAQQKLPDTHIRNLAATIITIEQRYGCPVDIEWALADNQLHILQVRPITTLTI